MTEAALSRIQSLDDRASLRAEEAFCSPPVVWVLRAASRFGDFGLTLATVVLLLVADGARIGLRFGVVTVAALVVQRSLKRRYARVRPCLVEGGPAQRAPIPDEGSFPSGHTLHAVMAAVVVSALLPPMAAAYAPLAALVAVSRVALGVHYPSDVLAGGLLGALFAALVLLLGAV